MLNMGLKIEAAGPRSWPSPFVNVLRFFGDSVEWLIRLQSQGSIVPIADRCGAVVVAYGAENAKAILSDDGTFKHSEEGLLKIDREKPYWHMYRTLPLMNGSAVKHRRRLMMPAMHREALASYEGTIVETVNSQIGKFSPGDTVDILSLAYSITKRVSIRTLLGFSEEQVPQALPLTAEFDYLNAAVADPKIFMAPWNIPGMPFHKWETTSQRVSKKILELIQLKRSAPMSTDMISLFMHSTDENGERLSDNEVLGEVAGLYAAGYDTTANTIAWTLLLLAQHPEIASRLSEELQSRGPDYLTTSGTLLDRVVKESMRLLPATPMVIPRITSEDCTLSGVRIPAGAMVIIPTITAHQNESVFERAKNFNPDRWLSLKPGLYDYFPFGVGARRCFGAPFADRQVRVVLSTLLSQLSLSSVSQRVDQKNKSIIMTPKRALHAEVGPAGSWGPARKLTGNITQLFV